MVILWCKGKIQGYPEKGLIAKNYSLESADPNKIMNSNI